MLQNEDDFRTQHIFDIYCFDDVVLPPLPSGVRLCLAEMKNCDDSRADDNPITLGIENRFDWVENWTAEDARTWRRIRRYVDLHDNNAAELHQNTACPIGSAIWPAAAVLCRWLLSVADDIRGSSILELGLCPRIHPMFTTWHEFLACTVGAGTGACGLYAAGVGASVRR